MEPLKSNLQSQPYYRSESPRSLWSFQRLQVFDCFYIDLREFERHLTPLRTYFYHKGPIKSPKQWRHELFRFVWIEVAHVLLWSHGDDDGRMQFFGGSEINPSPQVPTASGNNAHMMYVFNRNGVCLLYKEWNRLLHTLNPQQDHKLMFGLLFSLKSLTAKMDPVKLVISSSLRSIWLVDLINFGSIYLCDWWLAVRIRGI